MYKEIKIPLILVGKLKIILIKTQLGQQIMEELISSSVNSKN